MGEIDSLVELEWYFRNRLNKLVEITNLPRDGFSRRNADGSTRYKTRLVARDVHQRARIDFDEVYEAVVNSSTQSHAAVAAVNERSYCISQRAIGRGIVLLE